MKKTILFLILLACISVTVNAQTAKAETKKQPAKTEQMQLKDHVCTTACSNGNHVYAHGEKGHVCTKECAPNSAATGPTQIKEHVCTTACTGGHHVYAHGEKGHVCTDACKNK
jgi:hypothetical protein